MRRTAIAIAACSLGLLLAPATPPAQAATSVTMTAIGTISLWDTWCFVGDAQSGCSATAPAPNPVSMYGPVSPACGTTTCPSQPLTKWVFSAPGSPTTPATCTAHVSTAGGTGCSVRARGSLGNFLFPHWCGFNRGEINSLWFTTGNYTDKISGGGLGVERPGPYAMAWVVEDAPVPATTDKGVVEITLLDVPECGLNPTTGFAGEHEFQAQLSFTWAKA